MLAMAMPLRHHLHDGQAPARRGREADWAPPFPNPSLALHEEERGQAVDCHNSRRLGRRHRRLVLPTGQLEESVPQ